MRVAAPELRFAPPLEPKLPRRPYPDDLHRWARLLANLWGLRGLYLRLPDHGRILRFDALLREVQQESKRIMPEFRTEIMARGFYLCEETLAEPTEALFADQEHGWWVAVLVQAFDLSRYYGIVKPGADERVARSTAHIWREAHSLAYRCLDDELVDRMAAQITGGRSQPPDQVWELVKERLSAQPRA